METMIGRCPSCKTSVPVYTIKLGELFDPDSPFEVCYPHQIKKFLSSTTCPGSDEIPETTWAHLYVER